MFGLGATEMMVILVLVLIVFGAGKLPEVAGSLGKGIRSFKDGAKDPEIDLVHDGSKMLTVRVNRIELPVMHYHFGRTIN